MAEEQQQRVQYPPLVPDDPPRASLCTVVLATTSIVVYFLLQILSACFDALMGYYWMLAIFVVLLALNTCVFVERFRIAKAQNITFKNEPFRVLCGNLPQD